tara:strand:- start:46 stop:243 length:198 start_codon:yes stop_codon:yes gene_type:complete
MKDREIRKRLHGINSFMSTSDNETYLSGQDEHGEEFTMVFNTVELLEWLDIDYMKDRAKKYIENL